MKNSAIEKLSNFNKKFPKAREAYKEMQKWQIKEGAKHGIFYPSGRIGYISPEVLAFGAIENQATKPFTQRTQREKDLIEYYYGLHLFGAWRNTLGIYKIDKDIFSETIASPIPDETPSNIFSHLPEWCVYLLFPEDSADIILSSIDGLSTRAVGFWAVADKKVVGGKLQRTLNIVLDTENNINDGTDCYSPITIIIDENLTIKESILKYIQVKYSNVDTFLLNQGFNKEFSIAQYMLSLLLWLCVQEPDIIHRGEPITREQLSQPKFTRHKKTGAFVPPNQPFVYEIGKRLGGEVREYKEIINNNDKKTIKSSRKRPHIRRGHWHGYWYGSGQSKEFKVKWQSAIFVNS